MMKAIAAAKNKKTQKRKTKDVYRSWDPLTQSKFLFDLHMQLGAPISRATAYQLAVKATQD